MTAFRDDVFGSEGQRYGSALTKSQRKQLRSVSRDIFYQTSKADTHLSSLENGDADVDMVRQAIEQGRGVITQAQSIQKDTGSYSLSRDIKRLERILGDLIMFIDGEKGILDAVPSREEEYVAGMLSYCRKARRHQRELQLGSVDADGIKHIGKSIAFGRLEVNLARNSAQRFDGFFSQTSLKARSIESRQFTVIIWKRARYYRTKAQGRARVVQPNV